VGPAQSAAVTLFLLLFRFDRTTFELAPDPHWANSTGYLRAMMQGFIERFIPTPGRSDLTFLQSFVDYELENGLTPEGYAWSQVPYASANPGANDTPAGASLGRTTLSRMLLVRMGTAISACTR